MKELVDRINARKAELRLELMALDKALEVVKGLGEVAVGEATVNNLPSTGTAAPSSNGKSKGFLSAEAKQKISAAQKRIWAERKRGWAEDQKRRAG